MRYVTGSNLFSASFARLLTLSALGSAALLAAPALSAQNCPVGPSPDSTRTTQSTKTTSGGATTNGTCNNPGTGGGGGGGTVPTRPSSALSWSGGINEGQPIGGAPQRFGLQGTVFQNSVWAAFTSTQTTDSRGNANLMVGNSINPGPLQNLSTVVYNGGTVTGTGNPALGTLNNILYIAQADSYGDVIVLTSADGSSWTSRGSCGAAVSTGSVTMAPLNGKMYIATENASDQSLTLCIVQDVVTNPGASITTRNFPNVNMSFVAGMTNYTPPGGSPTLYIAYPSSAANANHNLYYYTTTDGVNFNYSTAAAGDQSSTTPSLASHRGYLYMGFRSNDGSHGFLTKVSTDGVNWSGYTNNGHSMGGPAALIGTGDSSYYPSQSNTINGSNNGQLFNLYVADDSTQALYTQSTP